MEQRNSIIGIEIERYEYFISFHKPPVRILFDQREVEAIRRQVAEKILAKEAKNIEEKNLVILNPPDDLDCSALFSGLVNSFSFDAVYRYSKAYAMIRVLGEALLFVIFLLVMFFAMLTVAGLIQRIFLGRQMEVPGEAIEPLTAREAMLKPGVGKTFWVRSLK